MTSEATDPSSARHQVIRFSWPRRPRRGAVLVIEVIHFEQGTAARDIRTDRVLDEVRASGGDLRRICALFGMSVKRAARYTSILDHPDLVQQSPSPPPT
ncbi:hypothetical protein [Amycolatopsis methanolica]|uniref:hypothetical protein n=1 Tax=Amycolatopsis methanolica TaxID=1814 RepID=UPI00342D2E58